MRKETAKIRMRRSKCFLLLFCAFLFVMPLIQAEANSRTDERIRVGLFYGSSAKSSYTVSGSNLRILDDGLTLLNTRESALEVTTAGTIYVSERSERSYEDAVSVEGMAYYDGSSFYSARTSSDLGYTARYDGVHLRLSGGESLIVDKARTVGVDSSDGMVGLSGAKYRETMEFRSEGYSITAMNNISIENYLKGVVAKEMPSSWNEEALKAQAIVARNYVATNKNKHISQGFNVCASTHCQVYGGYSGETARTNAAVDATAGELMYYGGAPVEGYFHSTSGGRTENSENLWNAALPYLVGVEDPYSTGTPFDNWTASFTMSEIKALLANNAVNIGEVTGVSITKTTENDRAFELTIYGTSGRHVLQKDRIRIFFGGEKLKSTYFTIGNSASAGTKTEVPAHNGTLSSIWESLKALIDVQNGVDQSIGMATGNTIVFNGKGYGHGVGMSQYGAQNMARAGYSYKEILKHYFKGVEIK